LRDLGTSGRGTVCLEAEFGAVRWFDVSSCGHAVEKVFVALSWRIIFPDSRIQIDAISK